MRPLPLILTVSLSLLVCACDGPDFDSRVMLSGYRVVGIEADPPEAAPDGVVTLRVRDFADTDDAIDYRWRLCLVDPGAALRYACPDPALELELGDTAEVTLDLGPGMVDLATRLADAPQGALNTDGSPPSLETGFDMLVQLDSGQDCEGCRRVHTVKRIHVRDAPAAERNDNPVIVALEMPAAAGPGDDVPLSVEVAPPQRFVDADGDMRREDYLFTWYSTLGEADPPLTFGEARATVLPLPSDARPGEVVTVVVAVRDGRGGLAVARAELTVR